MHSNNPDSRLVCLNCGGTDFAYRQVIHPKIIKGKYYAIKSEASICSHPACQRITHTDAQIKQLKDKIKALG
jgi:ribosomal protein S27AE